MSQVDLLAMKFKTEKLNQLQKLLNSLLPLESNLNIFGPQGSGKTTWANYIMEKTAGVDQYLKIDAKEIEEDQFKIIIEGQYKRHVLIENIEYLHKENQNILSQFIQKNSLNSKPVIITTSKRALKDLAQEGQLRQDLYYKLTVFKIELPELKDVSGDIETISDFYLKMFAIIYKKNDIQFSAEAIEKLRLYFWPGNIIELENVVERAILLSETQLISDKNIRFDDYQKHSSLDLSLGMSLSEVERKLIMQTLEHTDNNRTKAAHILGISIRTLRNKLNEYKEAGLI